jgi:hypothetical protein
LGNFSVRSGPPHPLCLHGLLTEELGFLHHRRT